MSVSKRTRFEVLRRDNHTCRYCGGVAPDVVLTVDHVTPVALGGTNQPSNLVAACKDCNAGKTSTSPDASLVEDVAADAFRWSAAMERAAQIMDNERELLEDYLASFDESWGCCSSPKNYRDSLIALYRSGLSRDEMLEAIRITNSAYGIQTSRFRYFCGVAWKRVERMQKIAESLIAADERDA